LLINFNLGNALKEQGRLKEALASYDQAIEIKPDYASAHYNCGNILLALSRLEEALTSYDKVIYLTLNCADTH